MAKITSTEIRMYKMGTGDCFALKFMTGRTVKFKMLIDAGTWSGKPEVLNPYIEDMLNYLDHHVNVLVVTHEHKDHVHAFDACRDLFTGADPLIADEIWMGWTENDKIKKVKEWKDEYGEKKIALAFAARKLDEAIKSEDYKKQFDGDPNQESMMGVREQFSHALNNFTDLHLDAEFSLDATYKGGLKGMEVVKKQIAKNNIKYYSPGKVIENLPGADGVKFYIMGPPLLYEDIKKEKGKDGESYDHNDKIEENNAFAAAVVNYDNSDKQVLFPFDAQYVMDPLLKEHKPVVEYEKEKLEWRKIDYDWLFGAGALALRMNSLTNNLSLAMAIEFEDSGKVMLFPGDAEYGSWSSWHNIKWTDACRNGKPHLTQDLLSRTVFYKVAHHLSHNGTAKRQGLEMMEDKDIVAMATLDYSNISDGWTGTMPNRDIIRDLLIKTKGRLMIMNTDDLYFDFNEEVPLEGKIIDARNNMNVKEAAAFKKNYKETGLYIQYTVSGK